MTLVRAYRPVRPSAVLYGDQFARLNARYALRVLNADLVIATARRVARRGLPAVATQPCGCGVDTLCPHAARLLLALSEALSARDWPVWHDLQAGWAAHRRVLSPGACGIYARPDAPALAAARAVLAGEETC